MGGSYTALATDAYAATYNPAGLGNLESTQFSGQHLSYLDSIHYEYLSFAVPLPRGSSCASPADCPGSAWEARSNIWEQAVSMVWKPTEPLRPRFLQLLCRL